MNLNGTESTLSALKLVQPFSTESDFSSATTADQDFPESVSPDPDRIGTVSKGGRGTSREPTDETTDRRLEESESPLKFRRRDLSQRVITPWTPDGTPRSSIDLHSQSDHSSETLSSEYPAVFANKFRSREAPSPSGSWHGPFDSPANEPVKLMMAFVQLVGFFTLDGALVNTSTFDKVKKKGTLSAQAGGGVLGIERSRKASSVLGSIGLESWRQSIGGILTGNHQSSFHDSKAIANTRAIPIISTPRAVLFVDLTLQPGESKTFAYEHKIPITLPPTFRGRTFKATYQLLVGIQQLQSPAETPILTSVEAPFRVVPSMTG